MESLIPGDLALGQERVSIGFYSSKTQLEPLAPPADPLAAPGPPSLERGRAVGAGISFRRFLPCDCSLSSSWENRHQRELQGPHSLYPADWGRTNRNRGDQRWVPLTSTPPAGKPNPLR